MNVNRKLSVTVIFFLVLITFPVPAYSDPCCIIVVPPPPERTPNNGKVPQNIGLIYSLLPFFAAVEVNAFNPSLKVDILYKSYYEAMDLANSKLGVLGFASINSLIWHKIGKAADLEIAAVTINRPYHAFYTVADGPTDLKCLKGKVIAIDRKGSLAHLFAIEALRSAEIKSGAVKFIDAHEHQGVFTAVGSLKADATPLFLGYDVAVPEFKFKQITLPEPIMFPSWAMYASSTTLEKETKEVRQFIRGLTKGVNILKTNPELIRPILKKRFNISNSKTQDFIIEKYMEFVIPNSIKPNPEGIKRTVELFSSITNSKSAPTLIVPDRFKKLYE